MKTVEETRLERLIQLKEKIGSVRKLADKLEISGSQLSQWLNESPDSKSGKPRRIGSESARMIEIKLNKEKGWMDQPIINDDLEIDMSDKELVTLVKMIKQLPRENRDHAKRLLDVANELSSRGETKKTQNE